MKTFENKVVVITGGTSGIGRETAIAFGREGAKVVVSGRREPEGAESVRLIEEAGGQGLFVKADVSNEEDVIRLVQATLEKFGRIDIAFNNAGISLGATPLLEATAEQFDKVFDINVRGIFFALKHEIAAMLKTGGGAIINNASVLGIRPLAGTSIYNASKSAIIGLTKSAALEFASSGVRVNVVCPGIIETDMTAGIRGNEAVDAHMKSLHPMKKFGKPSEVAAAVMYLASEGAGFSTGVVVTVDGGYAM
jgi:NAD(P)-dependent dehydrogenase (short-subunit alcohol dehydrogenase family)